jgi:predicted lipoprotein with Yx(FWY)xxD motif/uncharacterized membrane protein YphA (DoxX/SURF4 family)
VLADLARVIVVPRIWGPGAGAVAVARVGAGAILVAFSIGKFVNHEAEAASIDRYGFPVADLTTYAVGSLELVAGLLLIFGLATRVSALALAADMVGAISTAGRLDGGAVNLGLAPTLLAVMLLLLWAGAGRPSLDGRLARLWTPHDGARSPEVGGQGARTGRLRALLGLSVLGLFALFPVAPAGAASATLTVRDSDYGRVLFDGGGRALYIFTRDSAGRSACSGACARAWPPYLVNSRPKAGRDVRTRLIGTTRRSDGTRQATYAGRPLYYYVGDNGPGVIRCQNVFEFGGLWLVQRPSGRPVR